jgi:uncharacterized membrane protein (DUF4010 family)
MSYLPSDLLHFLYVVALAFLVGLELKTYRLAKNMPQKIHIGSTRTFTFIGILGFIFYKIDFWLYLAGFIALSAIYLVYYLHKLHEERSSILSFLLISLVYSFGPLIEHYNIWMPTLLFVLIVFILNANKSLGYLFSTINPEEFETLGKFLLLSAVILPILPKEPLPYIHISAFKIWLVVVVVSAISYGSYIAQKYVFKNRGYLLTGIFGGLYSSTATTVVLAKKSESLKNIRIIESAIVIATSMMYVRLLIIAAIFNLSVALSLALPMLLFAALGAVIAFVLYKKETSPAPIDDRNPLELGTALLFALLFVAMMVLTDFVTQHFGQSGLKILSFIIGFTDIDPFILSLLMGKYSTNHELIITSILIASGSNDILKSLYALLFSNYRAKLAAFWLFVLGVLTIAYPFVKEFV